METIIKSISVFNKKCVGCQRFKKDVMLTIMLDEDNPLCEMVGMFQDYMLTTEQAEYLKDELMRILDENIE